MAGLSGVRAWRGTSPTYADWAEALPVPPEPGRMTSGWWMVAAVPLGLAAWSALGWLLFAG
ncbi:hypothetical protein [Frigidibacter sp.]|uniref:hypothetical protein n=1 Tax=Frigidibacter sp. TaxID=2586418 RepID=UPI002735FDC5|nr:hypothetical protein [Frigidibacter sp.]